MCSVQKNGVFPKNTVALCNKNHTNLGGKRRCFWANNKPNNSINIGGGAGVQKRKDFWKNAVLVIRKKGVFQTVIRK